MALKTGDCSQGRNKMGAIYFAKFPKALYIRGYQIRYFPIFL